MKIMSTCGSFSFKNLMSKNEYIHCDGGCIYEKEGESLKLIHYSSETHKGDCLSSKGNVFQKINDIGYVNVEDDKHTLQINDEFKVFFKYSSPIKNLEEFFIDYDDALYLCNIDQEIKLKLPVEAYTAQINKEKIYALDEINKKLTKLSFDGNIEWEYSFNFDVAYNKPFIYKNPLFSSESVFAYFGSKSCEEINDKAEKLFRPKGGILVSMNIISGEKEWELELDDGLFNFEVFDNYLCFVGGSNLFFIDQISGALEKQLNLNLDPYFHIGGFSQPSIFVDEIYLFISSPRDERLIIIDRKKLDVCRDVKMPNGCRVDSLSHISPDSKKYYFSASTYRWDVYNHPVLEIDKDNIFSDVSFESEPEFEIGLEDSNVEGKEVVIEVKHSRIDDVIRFGEIYTRDEAHRYSYNYTGRSYIGREFSPEPQFNGVIRLRVKSCPSSDDIIKNQLAIMEERFKNWNSSEGCYSCIDNKKLTCLVTEFIN